MGHTKKPKEKSSFPLINPPADFKYQTKHQNENSDLQLKYLKYFNQLPRESMALV
jgi:hypothetical protein